MQKLFIFFVGCVLFQGSINAMEPAPIFAACQQGDLAAVQRLIKQDPTLVNLQSKHGRTPLYWAAKHGHTEIAQILVDAGADVNKQNNYGRTPLYWAVKLGHLEIAQILIKAGANRESSAIYSKSYWPPDCPQFEAGKTFGSCEKLSDHSILCFSIGANYRVTCCLYPDPKTVPLHLVGKSRCISFDSGGIIGDISNSTVNLQDALRQAQIQCAVERHTSHIVEEYTAALQSPIRYTVHTQDGEGHKFDLKTFKRVDLADYSLYNPEREMPDGTKLSSVVLGVTSTNWADHLPIFTNMIERLRQTFNLPEEYSNLVGYDERSEPIYKRTPLPITIMHDEDCDPRLRNLQPVAIHMTPVSIEALKLSGSLLQEKYSDGVLGAVLAHELFHIKQVRQEGTGKKYSSNGNNQEAAADLATILATHGPGLAIFLKESHHLNDNAVLPMCTRENVHEMLKEADEEGHPSPAARITFILTMNEYYQKAKALLLQDLLRQKMDVP